jgi:hypothetical protein
LGEEGCNKSFLSSTSFFSARLIPTALSHSSVGDAGETGVPWGSGKRGR